MEEVREMHNEKVLVWCGSGQMGGSPAESSPTRWEGLSCPETSFHDLWALLASAGWAEAVQRNKTSSFEFCHACAVQICRGRKKTKSVWDLLYLQEGLCTNKHPVGFGGTSRETSLHLLKVGFSSV